MSTQHSLGHIPKSEVMRLLMDYITTLRAAKADESYISLLFQIAQRISNMPSVECSSGDCQVTLLSAFDEEEIIENCTVQVLKNSINGDISVGWWKN